MASTAAMNKIETAHQMYREGKYGEALDYYTDALSMAKTKPQKIALHSNRAACYLKLHRFNQAAEECTSVLELDHKHTGALMLRAQTLVTLKEYNSALFDVNRLIELNPSSEMYKNLQARLKTQVMIVCFVQGKSLAPIPEDEAELDDEEDYIDESNLEEAEEEEQDNKNVEMEECGNEDSHATNASGMATSGKSEIEKVSSTAKVITSQNQTAEKPPDQKPLGWNTIPKPKGHSHLDYSRWDSVEDDSSDDEDDDDEDDDSQPQYRFRVKTVGVRAVK